MRDSACNLLSVPAQIWTLTYYYKLYNFCPGTVPSMANNRNKLGLTWDSRRPTSWWRVVRYVARSRNSERRRSSFDLLGTGQIHLHAVTSRPTSSSKNVQSWFQYLILSYPCLLNNSLNSSLYRSENVMVSRWLLLPSHIFEISLKLPPCTTIIISKYTRN